MYISTSILTHPILLYNSKKKAVRILEMLCKAQNAYGHFQSITANKLK